MAILTAIGWGLWGLCLVFSLSGLLYIARAVRNAEGVTYMGLTQFAGTTAAWIVFLVTDLEKLWLAALIPAVWIASFTPIGRVVGAVTGTILVKLFGRRAG